VVVLTDLTLAGWALLELALRVREARQGKGRRAHDRGTRALVAIAIGLAILAAVAASRSPQLPAAVRLVGLIAMWLGLAVRIWAIASLGAAFRTTVEVDPGQRVVSSGPYRWVRHPSYTGLLLIVAGFGLARGTWLSLAAGLLLPLPALGRRIHVEEAELNRVLGDAYRGYQASTARLLPGVW
jgi:protein-S-isoprenylcysteine O-methyltransferase Ste14